MSIQNNKKLKIIKVPQNNISVRKTEHSDFLREKIRFDDVLIELIPNLDNFEFLSGKEGRAYFIDDDYVVKKLKIGAENLDNFNRYCKEIKDFADSGLAVPKIYTWMTIENGDNYHDAFIFQQRIKGQRLFESDIVNIYDKCKDICTKDEFLKAVKHQNENRELFGLIVKKYMEGFLQSNKKILELSDKAIEHFIKSDFEMAVKARYGYTDMHSENIILSDKAITIIDNYFDKRQLGHNVDELKISVLKDMMLIFCYNEMSKKYLDFDCGLMPEFKRINEENLEVCSQAMRRMIKKTNQLYRPLMTSPVDYFGCEKFVKSVLNKKYVGKVCKEIQRDFW